MKYAERIYSDSEIKLIKEIFDMSIKQIYDEDLKKIVSDCKEMFLEHQKSLKEIERLNNQLQQKENIIKEVREYIENNNFHCKNQEEQEQYDKELLEILDKENNNE